MEIELSARRVHFFSAVGKLLDLVSVSYVLSSMNYLNQKIWTNCSALCLRGNTAIMNAASKEDEKMMKILLEAGANFDRFDASGNPSISWACQHHMSSIISVLVEKGAYVTTDKFLLLQ